MRVTEVRYQRIKNLGNYENERAEVTVAVNEGDEVRDALNYAKEEVEIFLILNESDRLTGEY